MPMIITDENKEESRLLFAIFNSKKKSLDLTQDRIAETLGTSQTTIAHLFHARMRIDLTKGLHLAKLLKCQLSDFSPRLQEELDSLKLLESQTRTENSSTSDDYSSCPVVPIDQALNIRSPYAGQRMTKPYPEFTGFFVIVADEMMADDSPTSIPISSFASVDTNKTDLEDGKFYLLTSEKWPHPIIREARNISGRWQMRSKNAKFGIDVEFFEDGKHLIIGRIIGIGVNM